MNKNQRIKVAVKWLIAGGVAKNQEGLGKILGYKNKSSFSQVLNGLVPIPEDFINRLCALDSKLNAEWLSDGKDEMIKMSGNTQNNKGGDNSFNQQAMGNNINLEVNESNFKTIEEYEREIAFLKETIKQRDEVIAAKNELIEILRANK